MLETLARPETRLFVILVAAFALLITERIRNDVVGVLIVLSLWVSGLLKPEQALAGFGSEPAIVVVAIFVMSAALHQTGLSETLGRWIGRLAGASFNRAVAVIMPSVALLSAFTHHVTTTAVMLPVTLKLSRDREIPPSKLLMPLSFAASLGTTITIIGAPAFLIASAALHQAGRPGLGIFSIAPIGLALSAAGTIFMLLVGRFILPSRKGAEDAGSRFRLDEYFTEVKIMRDSPLLGKSVDELEGDDDRPVKVVGLIRDGRRVRRPFGDRDLREGDVVLVRTSPDQMLAFRKEPGVELHPVAQYESDTKAATAAAEDDGDLADKLVQVVVAPNSDMAGRSIADVDFRRRYGVIVLGLWRQRGWLDQELSQIKLRQGDVLVLQGDDESLARVAADRNFLMMVPFHGETRLRRRAPIAAAIMLGTIVAAALNVPLQMAGIAGAVLMVLAGCVTPGQAYRAIDARIYVFIAGAIPLGAAMEKSGAAKLLGGWLTDIVGDWTQFAVLMSVFAVVAVVTQFMSDAATTALFAPVAIALANGLGHAPEPYVVTVAMAAVTAFITPLGHHGNLLIYGPGGYRFADFVRVGAPLTVVVAFVVVILAPVLWHTPPR